MVLAVESHFHLELEKLVRDGCKDRQQEVVAGTPAKAVLASSLLEDQQDR